MILLAVIGYSTAEIMFMLKKRNSRTNEYEPVEMETIDELNIKPEEAEDSELSKESS